MHQGFDVTIRDQILQAANEIAGRMQALICVWFRPFSLLARKITPSNGPVSLSPFQSWPDCIINMSGYDFRKGPQFSVAFITNIAESNFRYTQDDNLKRAMG
jgi:hypothetical protein